MKLELAIFFGGVLVGVVLAIMLVGIGYYEFMARM